MSAPPDPAFMARARKLARVLDDRFDGFGQLLEDDALDHAASILEAIEDAGCTLVFPGDAPETLPSLDGATS